MRTATQHLADLTLGVPVEAWVLQLREDGKSWREIARALESETGGRVSVTERTLLNWTTRAA